MSSHDFLFGKFEQIFEMARVSLLKQRVGEHLAERRRDVHGEARRGSAFVKILEDEDEGQINFRDSFVEPVFFEKFGVLRMAHEGQVRVEDETEESCWQENNLLIHCFTGSLIQWKTNAH